MSRPIMIVARGLWALPFAAAETTTRRHQRKHADPNPTREDDSQAEAVPAVASVSIRDNFTSPRTSRSRSASPSSGATTGPLPTVTSDSDSTGLVRSGTLEPRALTR